MQPDSLPQLRTFSMYGRNAGSARVRVFDWLSHLDLAAESSTYLDSASLSPRLMAAELPRTLSAEFHVRSLSKKQSPLPTFVSKGVTPFDRGDVISRINQNSAHAVFDFDDAIMTQAAGLKGFVRPSRQVWHSALHTTDVAIAGNDYLAELAAPLQRNTVVIPSCVEPTTYIQKQDYAAISPLRIVWIGSHSTEPYLEHVRDAVNRLHKAIGATLTVISSGTGPLAGFTSSAVERRQWKLDSFASDLVSADVGIMPLTDGAWERGKCAYKLLQYGATALPVIGTPVGANRKALELLGGFAAETPDDWHDALLNIAEMPASERETIGTRALNGVLQSYSFSAWEQAWREAVGIS